MTDSDIDTFDKSAHGQGSNLEKNQRVFVTAGGSEVEIKQGSRWLTWIVGSDVPDIPYERQDSPQARANIFSRLSWAWITPLLRTGYLRTIVENDIWKVAPFYSNEYRLVKYNKHYKRIKESAEAKGKKAKFVEFRALLHTLKWEMLCQSFCITTMITIEICTPILSRTFLSFIQNLYDNEPVNHGRGVGLGIGNTILTFSFSYLFIGFNYFEKTVSEGLRCILLTAVYNKALKLSPAGRQSYSVSKITSLSTVDINRIMMGSRWALMVFLFPLMVGGTIGILVWNLGVSALAGVGLIVVGLSLNMFIVKSISGYRGKSIPFQDKRISLIRETVQNMRIIKYYGWENSFLKLIQGARDREKYYLRILGALKAGSESGVVSIPQFGAVLALGVRAAMGQILTPALVFPSISLFITFIPLTGFFVMGLAGMADAWKSLGRLEALFSSPEEENYVEFHQMDDIAVRVTNGSFSWASIDVPEDEETIKQKKKEDKKKAKQERKDRARKGFSEKKSQVIDNISGSRRPFVAREIINELQSINSAEQTFQEAEDQIEDNEADAQVDEKKLDRAGALEFPGLKNLNLDIKKGEFIVIVGAIGSGKTTLLSALGSMLTKDEGSVEIDGEISSCLSHWAKNATIRENILFGKPFDPILYANTVRACCLEDDFANFRHGDHTEVGERGITLSGGQKARISLARAVYFDGDIFLLDDVLSAVDAKVGKKILDECLLKNLSNRTRILATHHLHIINKADRVIFMDGRGNAFFDTTERLRADHQEFDALLAMFIDSDKEKEKEKEAKEEEDISIVKDTKEPIGYSAHDGSGKKTVDVLIAEETKSDGAISLEVIKAYILSGSNGLGYGMLIILIIAMIVQSTANTFSSIWLSFLTGEKFSNLSLGGYLGIYLLIIFLGVLLRFFQENIVCYFCFTSSTNLHKKATDRLFNAPMSFFDTTPLGRVITRFTEDIANMDTNTYQQLGMFMYSLGNLLGSLITVFVYIPYAIALLVPILLVFFVCLNYYRASAREIKRFDALFRSAMISHTTETYNGLQTIIAYKQKENYSEELSKKIDNMNSAMFLTISNQSWLTFRLNVAATMVSFMVMIMCSFRVFSINASSVGLLVSILPEVSQSLAYITPTIADLENELNSVERVWEYGVKIPQEAPHFITETQPPPEWPAEGRIEFKDVSLRYRDNMPNVLKNLTISAAPSEKIGICGRTGAGKSTILNSLFRIIELSGGQIVIDGLDISKLGLHALRSKLSIIPQEPVLFEGTIRSNLDPFDERTDVELWDALRRSGLIEKDELASINDGGEHKFHLDQKTNDEGTNYSLGERQLLTLARALVRQSKILVLDEATATVDYETDQKIQETIATEFKDCTILCIAHRLKTILNYDKILVLENGQKLEFDTPYNLFMNPDSVFRNMCEHSRITEADFN